MSISCARGKGISGATRAALPAPKLSEGQRAEFVVRRHLTAWPTIWVNGKHAGSSADMLIERRFDVTDLIEQGGENTVQVIIRPVVPASQDHLLGMFSLGNFATEESVYIRKAPHMYGWDIMPRLVSAGLWRGVELRVLEPARFTDVTWVTTHIDTATRNVSLFVDFQTKLPFDLYDKAKLRFTLTRNGKEAWRGEPRSHSCTRAASWRISRRPTCGGRAAMASRLSTRPRAS